MSALSRWLVGLLAAGLLLGPAGSAAGADEEPVEARAIVAIDGDSILVSMDGHYRTVRYPGVDAPDLTDDNSEDCFALEAWWRNAELVEGQVVRLYRDVSETDHLGRLLRYVYLADGTFVNGQLVAEGLAHAVSIDPTSLTPRSWPAWPRRRGRLGSACGRRARSHGDSRTRTPSTRALWC